MGERVERNVGKNAQVDVVSDANAHVYTEATTHG